MHTCFLNIHGVRVKVNAQRSDTIKRIENVYSLFLSSNESNLKAEFELTGDDEGELFSILARNSMFAFHAAAYENNNHLGIILPGRSDSGKTTIAFSALISGYPFIGDDVVLCHFNGRDYTLLPFKSYLHLKQNGESKKYEILEQHPLDILCKTYARAVVFPQIITEELTRITQIDDWRTVFINLLRTSVWVTDNHLRREQASMLGELCKLPAYNLYLGTDHKIRRQLAIEMLDRI